ncbi:MAG: serine/threonine-protein kinase [Microcoleaceae cyanobacterium]
MSYCFNPACEHPQNRSDHQFCESCGSGLVLNFHPGNETLAPQYRGLKLIGRGGFGRTFLAVDRSQPLQPRCVIKQFLPQFSHSKANVARFRQEAQQLQHLGQHRQIPAGISDFEFNGYFYLVQEFIEGKNLAQELLEKDTFDENKIRQLLKDLLPVLEFVHRHNIIHRDIKPENIIRRRASGVNQAGGLVLVDFGAAKQVTERLLPQTATIIGSAAFTAPEQLMGKAVFASDLYSLGVTCIHLLTGVSPFDLFDGQEGTWVWRDYLKNPVSLELGQVLDKMLQGATNHRYHSAKAVLRQLQPRSQYVAAFPALKNNIKKSVNSEDESSDQSIALLEPVPQPNYRLLPAQNCTNLIQDKLQQAVEKYPIQLQVNWQKQHQLIVVINRLENEPINYMAVARTISQELTQLNIAVIHRVKILGRIQGQTVPEWKIALKVGYKTQVKKKLKACQTHPLYQKAQQLQHQSFWSEKLQDREFILDSLMGLMIGFIFSFKVVILHPVLGILIALGFIKIKQNTKQRGELAINQLFATVATLFVVLGASSWKLIHQDFYSIILAGLFLSLPIFYTKTD